MPRAVAGPRELDPQMQDLWKRTLAIKWEEPYWPADKEKERLLKINRNGRSIRGVHRNPNSSCCYSRMYLAGNLRYLGRFMATEHAARWTDMMVLKFWKYRKRGGLSEPTDAVFYYSKAQAERDLATPALAEVVTEAIAVFQMKNWLVLPSHQTARRQKSVTGDELRSLVGELKSLINVVGGDVHAIKQSTPQLFDEQTNRLIHYESAAAVRHGETQESLKAILAIQKGLITDTQLLFEYRTKIASELEVIHKRLDLTLHCLNTLIGKLK